jgi:hypothetical protein
MAAQCKINNCHHAFAMREADNFLCPVVLDWTIGDNQEVWEVIMT